MTQENDPLAALDGAFQSSAAERDDGTIKPLPDGIYLTKITDAKVDLSRTSQQVMFVLEFDVLAGPKKGRKVWKRHMLTKGGQPNPDALPKIKGDLDILGLQIAKLPELRERAKELVGKITLIKVTTPKEFTNVYLQRVVNDAAEVATLTQQHDAGIQSGGVPSPVAGGGDMFGAGAPSTAGATGAAGDIPF